MDERTIRLIRSVRELRVRQAQVEVEEADAAVLRQRRECRRADRRLRMVCRERRLDQARLTGSGLLTAEEIREHHRSTVQREARERALQADLAERRARLNAGNAAVKEARCRQQKLHRQHEKLRALHGEAVRLADTRRERQRENEDVEAAEAMLASDRT